MGKYTGTFPSVKVKISNKETINNMQSWAKMIAADNRYYYKTWSSDVRTHQCPICHPELMTQSYKNSKGSWPEGKDGWNCIGLSWAIWHHGGGIDCECNCGVISNEVGNKLLKASDEEALNIVQTKSGIKNIKVIRNNGKKIPKTKVKPGDIGLLFEDKVYKHSFFIMSSNKIADSTGSGSQADQIRADRDFDGRYVSGLKVIIRYTGKGTRSYIKKGDEGNNIKNLQKFLNWALDLKLKVDGIYGDNTEKAVKEFQTKVFSKKEADGLFGKKSLEAAKNFDKKSAKIDEPPKKVKTTYPGVLPSYILKKTNSQVISDAVLWAKWIAKDNDFHYGYTNKNGSSSPKDWSPNAHHNGCYFCGTNKGQKKGMLMPEHTYCCNPFVGAAWAHGGCDTKAMSLCSHGGSWSFGTGTGSYHQSDRFKRMGHPKMTKLQAGDVLCMDTHIALYIGNGQLAEAGSGDDNIKNSTKWNNSIHIRTLTEKGYKSFKRVYRYIGSVNTAADIKHGEVSDRVKLWQAFLNWYFDGKVGTPDRYFGDNTLKWTKKFQKEQNLKVTGAVNKKTLAAATAVKK